MKTKTKKLLASFQIVAICSTFMPMISTVNVHAASNTVNVTENTASGTDVYTFDEAGYTLESGISGEDNAKFTIA